MTRRSTIAVLTSLMLAGCASMQTEAPKDDSSAAQVDTAAPVTEATPAPATTPLEQTAVDTRVLPAAEAQPPASEVEVAADPLTIPGAHKDPASPLAQRVIYFDFDSAVIHPRFQPILEAHATYLKANPQFKVTLEGHADERGSREYNLALGQRRAESVRRALALLGVSDDQMEAVSFGEERPAVEGHDESAWKMNRRTEIRYVDE